MKKLSTTRSSIKLFSTFSLLLVIFMLASISYAAVCDGLTGNARGLCIAATLGMKCDSAEPSASATACERVAREYEATTGETPPWVATACPCNLFATIPFGDVLEANCSVFEMSYQTGYGLRVKQTNGDMIDLTGFDNWVSGSGRSCGVVNFIQSDGLYHQLEVHTNMNDAQYQDCMSIARNRAINEVGVLDCSF